MHVEAINIGTSDALGPVGSVRAIAGRGLEGDRYFFPDGAGSGEALTLIEAEALEDVGLTERSASATRCSKSSRPGRPDEPSPAGLHTLIPAARQSNPIPPRRLNMLPKGPTVLQELWLGPA